MLGRPWSLRCFRLTLRRAPARAGEGGAGAAGWVGEGMAAVGLAAGSERVAWGRAEAVGRGKAASPTCTGPAGSASPPAGCRRKARRMAAAAGGGPISTSEGRVLPRSCRIRRSACCPRPRRPPCLLARPALHPPVLKPHQGWGEVVGDDFVQVVGQVHQLVHLRREEGSGS